VAGTVWHERSGTDQGRAGKPAGGRGGQAITGFTSAKWQALG